MWSIRATPFGKLPERFEVLGVLGLSSSVTSFTGPKLGTTKGCPVHVLDQPQSKDYFCAWSPSGSLRISVAGLRSTSLTFPSSGGTRSAVSLCLTLHPGVLDAKGILCEPQTPSPKKAVEITDATFAPHNVVTVCPR